MEEVGQTLMAVRKVAVGWQRVERQKAISLPRSEAIDGRPVHGVLVQRWQGPTIIWYRPDSEIFKAGLGLECGRQRVQSGQDLRESKGG